MIAFACAHCDRRIKVKDELGGVRVKCPACGQFTAVPSGSPGPVSAKQPGPEAGPTMLPGQAAARRRQDDVATLPPQHPARATHPGGDAPLPPEERELIEFLSPALAPGEIGRLGPYRVLKVLGAGGMGAVFQAEDPRLERLVALKVMLPQLAASSTNRERFLREAKAAAAIEHDHVVAIHQVGEDRGVPFLAMPFLKGEPLDQRLEREGRLPTAEVLRVGREVAEGLAAAHERGLIHRGIKPANIWLEGERGRVKLRDFGLARSSRGEGGQQLTASGVILGTPAYMAPEQANGAAVDARCDLFSLGCVLYRACAGQLPFQGADLISTLMAVATETPPEPRALNAAVPPALSGLVMRLLAKKPEDRPPSARAVAEALAAIEKGATAPADEDGRTADAPCVIARRRAPREDATLPEPSRPERSPKTRAAAQGRRARSPQRSRPAWLPWAVAGGLGVAVLLVVATVVVLRVKTDKGEVVLSTDDPDVEVVVKQAGRQIEVLDLKTRQKVELPSGEYEVALGGGKPGLRLSTDTFTLKRGGQQIVTVRRVPAPAVAEAAAQDRAVPPAKTPEPDAPQPPPQLLAPGELRRFTGHSAPIKTVALSPDGLRALSGSGFQAQDDYTVRLWDVATGRQLRLFAGHGGFVQSVAFSPDGRRALSGGADHTMRLWDLETGAEVRRFTIGSQPFVNAVVFCPDGRHALSGGGGDDNLLRLWDLDTGAEVRTFGGHTHWINAVAVSTDGRRALSGGGPNDATVCVWEVETGRQLHRLTGHTGAVEGVAFSPDSRYAVSGGADRIVRLWDLETGHEGGRFEGHEAGVQSVAFSPDGSRIVSGGQDKTLRLWDVRTRKETGVFRGHTEAVWSVAFAPDGRRVLSGSGDRTLRLWDVAAAPPPPAVAAGPEKPPDSGQPAPPALTAHLVRTFEGEPGYNSAAFSRDGRRLASWGGTTVRVWDAATGKELRRFPGHVGNVDAAVFSPDGRLLTLDGWGGSIHLWDVATGRETGRFGRGVTARFWAAKFAPDGRTLFTGSEDHAVLVWNMTTGKVARRFLGHTAPVVSVQLSADGKYAASVCPGDRTVRLWDVPSGRELGRAETTAFWSQASFSPGGRRLLVAAPDNSARLLDLETGKVVQTFRGHADPVTHTAFTPDGRFAVTAAGVLYKDGKNVPGADRTVRVWDVATGREVLRFENSAGGVTGMDLSPDGRQVLTGSLDSLVRLWQLPEL